MLICWEHDTVSAWECRYCRREKLDAIIEEAIEKTKEDIRRAFDDAAKMKRYKVATS